MMYPPPQTVREIMARGLLDDRTVRRAYVEPERVRPTSLERVRRAAVELGHQPPPAPRKAVSP